MKRKLFAILLALALCTLLALPALADRGYAFDSANQMDEDQLSSLNDQAEQVFQQTGFAVCFELADDTGGQNIDQFAAQAYGSLCGAADGTMLVLTHQDACLYLSGSAEQVFSEDDKAALIDSMFTHDDLYDVLAAYISEAGEKIARYKAAGGSLTATALSSQGAAAALMQDGAGLLSADQAAVLETKLEDVSQRQQCDVAVVTVDSLEGKTATEYADDFFDSNGYGQGENRDGILLLVAMGDRDWAISTHGYCIDAFTDAGQKYLVSQFKSDLSDGNYAAAFNTFASQCDDFLTHAKNGQPYTSKTLPKAPLSGIWFPIALAVGLLAGFIGTGVMKSDLKTVHRQAAANSYVRAGSMNLSLQQDTFLYNQVTRAAKPQKSDSDSSTHTSSSGESHGGSSGGF